MKKLTLLIAIAIAIAILLQSCGGDCPMQKELATVKTELEKARLEISTLKQKKAPALMHTVYLKTRPDLTNEETADLKTKMQSLASLEGVIGFCIGEPAATGDPRLNSDYSFVLQMGFSSETDLAAYQKNDSHIQARESTKGYLAGPPVVFDYWLKTPSSND